MVSKIVVSFLAVCFVGGILLGLVIANNIIKQQAGQGGGPILTVKEIYFNPIPNEGGFSDSTIYANWSDKPVPIGWVLLVPDPNLPIPFPSCTDPHGPYLVADPKTGQSTLVCGLPQVPSGWVIVH